MEIIIKNGFSPHMCLLIEITLNVGRHPMGFTKETWKVE